MREIRVMPSGHRVAGPELTSIVALTLLPAQGARLPWQRSERSARCARTIASA